MECSREILPHSSGLRKGLPLQTQVISQTELGYPFGIKTGNNAMSDSSINKIANRRNRRLFLAVAVSAIILALAGWLSWPRLRHRRPRPRGRRVPAPPRHAHVAADRDSQPRINLHLAATHAGRDTDRLRPVNTECHPRGLPRRRPHRRRRFRPARVQSACSSRGTTRVSSTCCGPATWPW